MSHTELFIAMSSLLLTLAGLFFTWYHWRRSELRRDEVLSWANECIECLQALFIISFMKEPILNQNKINEVRLKAIFDTSTLIERGRLFFKNEVSDNFGSEKPAAYRGYRPRILDHLVIAHQIARYWPNNGDEEIKNRSELAENCIKNFVSLVQKEVGRDRSASAEVLKGGKGVRLTDLMADLKSTHK